MTDLLQAFRDALAPTIRRALEHAEWPDLVRSKWDEGAAAWPGLSVSKVAWARFVAERLATEKPLESLALLHSDAFLVVGVLTNTPTAIETFVSRFEHWLTASRAVGSADDELAATMLSKLLVAEAGQLPRLSKYAGRGPLKGWLRVLIANERVDRHRSPVGQAERLRDDEVEVVAQLASSTALPEEAMARAEARRHVMAALREAYASLDARGRAVLRMHALERATIDDIASVTRVHRTTAFRWLERARHDVMTRTFDLLKARLQLESLEVRSLVRALPTDLDASLHSLFGEPRR